LQDFAAALQESSFGAFARGGAYVWANIIHLFGMVMLVGGIGLLDLRIVGFFPSLPLAAASRILTRFAVVGLILIVPSGLTLFAADAASLWKSETFRWKLSLIGLALANAVAFRVLWRRYANGVDMDVPIGARMMAGASVILWLWIAALGRLIAYA
jgi:hypothetical protein